MDKYMDLIKQDIIEPIRPLLQNGAYRFTPTGQLEADLRMQSETPWIHVRQDSNRNCALWHQVWFNHYGFIPSGCQKCWKVVVRPHYLSDLFKLHDLLTQLDMPSKCGIEKRYSVHALYGGYLYNDSKEEGLSCLEHIRPLLKEHVSPGTTAFLKRGCTEFEHKHGDSRNWEVTPEQLQLERRLEDLFVEQRHRSYQSREMQTHIMANWVRFAFANGDITAKKFMTDPLYPPYVTYEREEME